MANTIDEWYEMLQTTVDKWNQENYELLLKRRKYEKEKEEWKDDSFKTQEVQNNISRIDGRIQALDESSKKYGYYLVRRF